jgi:hypothetical protein
MTRVLSADYNLRSLASNSISLQRAILFEGFWPLGPRVFKSGTPRTLAVGGVREPYEIRCGKTSLSPPASETTFFVHGRLRGKFLALSALRKKLITGDQKHAREKRPFSALCFAITLGLLSEPLPP